MTMLGVLSNAGCLPQPLARLTCIWFQGLHVPCCSGGRQQKQSCPFLKAEAAHRQEWPVACRQLGVHLQTADNFELSRLHLPVQPDQMQSIPAGNFGVSGLHLTFNDQEEWAAMSRQGFLQRTGLQYHWQNNGYETFEDFLAELKQPKRKTIRQVGASLLSDEGLAGLRRCRLRSGSRNLRDM